MPIGESELALLRHPRLAALATSAWPAWLWRADGSQLVWTNAAGAAVFGAASVDAAVGHPFDDRAVAAQIVRLGQTLPAPGQERLERLRGLGAGFGRALTCACSRLAIRDSNSAVLVAATEPAGPALPLAERVRRLLGEDGDAVAIFAADGSLLAANAQGRARLSGATTLTALGLPGLAATTFGAGTATATIGTGEAAVAIAAMRLGHDDARVIMLTLTPTGAALPHPASAPSSAAAAAEPGTVAPPPAATVELPAAPEEPVAERRHPLRFVWHIDADGRFGVGSDEFVELVGPRTVAAFGRPWSEIASAFNLDPDHRVASALSTHETWSGIVTSWPVDDDRARLPVELSGLPVFDRDRNFRGYRGFGVCRDIDRLNELAKTRRQRQAAAWPEPQIPSPPSAELPAQPAAAEPEEHAPSLEPPAPEPPPEQASKQPSPPAIAPPVAGPAEPSATEPAAPREDVAGAAEPEQVAPAAANVVPFRQSAAPDIKAPPALSPVERRAFRELAQELTARLRAPQQTPEPVEAESAPAEVPAEAPAAPAAESAAAVEGLLHRIPIGLVIYRRDALLFVNRVLLDWSGYADLAAIETAGGLHALFAAPGADALLTGAETASLAAQALSLLTRSGAQRAVEGRLFTLSWHGSPALALIATDNQAAVQAAAAHQQAEQARSAAAAEISELKSILDLVSDGIVTLDSGGRILLANAGAASLFGHAGNDLAGRDFFDLFAPESERALRDRFSRVGPGSPAIDVAARAGGDRLVPLALTFSRLDSRTVVAVLRDVTLRKQVEEELRNAKRETLRAASAKTEFLGKISHEIRTPLNAMTGFAEVIMAERFGPIGNERYREYVRDIHNAGAHLVAMLNDLLDLSKVESGQIELTLANVNLNELTQQCVGIMQPQANRARIIIRTSLTPSLPQVVADERTLRQIVLNLISNSIKFTGPGGQVIVSTVFSDAREAILRVRDTGIGMNEKDIQAALEPFQQTATSGSFGSGGTGFGLSLTKALAEANRANFSIKSAPNAGTLVEIAFPPSRITAN